MKPTPRLPLIVGYVASHAERARLTGALRGWARAQWAESLAEVVAAVRRAKGAAITVILAPRDGDGHSAAPIVRELRRIAPSAAVVAHCHTGLANAAGIRQMAEAGVHEFLFVGVDDSRVALRSVVAAAQRACAADAVLDALLPVLPAAIRPVAEYCVTHAAEARSVDSVASALGVHRKTLRNRCVAGGSPSPARLIAWCRLMLAAQLLSSTGQTVEWVALEMEYPSDKALRNAMKRYTALRASEVRRQGGLRCVLDLFVQRLRPAPRAAQSRAALPAL
ncbi:MAG: helix-turn-helix domain-containing protein [Gemmatimonadaceae bacterium]|nr:helix-turn-helix domain-containing protein [Gemmatimonadaceae bacterium]